MEMLLGVGGPRAPIVATGWDLWPVVGLVAGLFVARRLLGFRWGAPLIMFAIAAMLGLPLAVGSWGVVPAFTGLFGPAIAVRLWIDRRPPRSTEAV